MTLGRGTQLVLVFAGGALGGAARIVAQEVFPVTSGAIPWDLLAVNLLGSVALGIVAATALPRAWWYPALGPGFFGGFTTFSAITCVHYSTTAGVGVAAALLAATIAVCAAGAALGLALGARWGAVRGGRV